jgi:hypothetical protein
MKLGLPEELVKIAERHPGPGPVEIQDRMRPSEACATPAALSAQKATRLSFSQLLARRMLDEGWTLTRQEVDIDAEGCGRLIYEIDFGKYQSTYIARTFPAAPGVPNENLGRRAGANRDIWGTLFLGRAGPERIAEEFAIVGPRDITTMRARADVLGWTPGSRSVRIFNDVVAALADGRQPAQEVIRRSGYLIRNGGFVASGRMGTISYPGIPADHPLKHPYFADFFGLLLLREVGVDLVNAMAAARSERAASLSDGLATFFGVGNASGQGMCVALQRWPQWFSTWLLVREFCLARAKLMIARVGSTERRRLIDLLERAVEYYDFVTPDSEAFVVPHKLIAENLRLVIRGVRKEHGTEPWAVTAAGIAETFDAETAEVFNALLIEIYPDFADDVASYIPVGMAIQQDYAPERSVGEFRRDFLSDYHWELSQDLRHSDARRHFWYHSIENGEQRRGERVVDPHEHFESFIDHLGALQRLAAILVGYPDETPMAIVVADHPELAFAAARVETMAHRPYKEIRGNLLHKDFSPAHLIRFFLSVFGLESTYPLNIRWVPGVVFQGFPAWRRLDLPAQNDWKYRNVSSLAVAA